MNLRRSMSYLTCVHAPPQPGRPGRERSDNPYGAWYFVMKFSTRSRAGLDNATWAPRYGSTAPRGPYRAALEPDVETLKPAPELLTAAQTLPEDPRGPRSAVQLPLEEPTSRTFSHHIS